MENFISELFYDNVRPQSKPIPPDSSYSKALDKLAAIEETLLEKLKGEERRLFNDYTNTWGEVTGYCEETNFIIGFRLGAHMIFDVFVNED